MARPLTTTEFEIPQRSGEVLCIPPAAQFLAVARANAASLRGADAAIAGMPLGELRHRARSAVLAGAAAYAAATGLPPPGPDDDRLPLIAAGHQPFLFHPGIWSKHLLLDRFAGRAHLLNIPVDCDAAEDVGADAPHLDGGLSIVRETLVRVEPDVPYEAVDAPTPPQWQAFLERVEAQLRTLPRHRVQEVFAAFRQQTADLAAPDIGTFLTLARARHEGGRRYGEVPVSRVSGIPEFRRFVLHILRDAEAFAATYNAHLDAYRERFNVRTTAQPFPNLERDGPRVELPFWVIRGGRRRPLIVERQGSRLRLWAGAEEAAVVGGEDPEDLAGLALRPKALALTAFMRLCLVDLFIHGVGGGRYDRVTDAVIEEFFGVGPPRYAVVSATLHLPLSEFDPADERAAVARRLLEVQHNPERLLEDPTPEHRQLIEAKWQWIARLDAGALTRRERREATQHIREINERLSAALSAERQALERRISGLLEVDEASTAATHRGYPFCYFPRRAVEELVDAMVAAP